MPPRIIHIPLSGGDRKAQAKGIRYARRIHNSAYRESVLIRSSAETKIREADRLDCEAWNAIMWAGGPAMPSPDVPQAEPTIAKAINGDFDVASPSFQSLLNPGVDSKVNRKIACNLDANRSLNGNSLASGGHQCAINHSG